MRDILRIAALGLLTGTLLVTAFYAPGPVYREVQFLGCILLVTVMTRSMSAGSGLSAFGLGLGAIVLLVVGAGRGMSAAGLDTAKGIVNWALIPSVEEALKLAPVAIVAWVYGRRQRLTPNPSDFLMLGCCAGAGFALAENATLLYTNPGIAIDMTRQYGPNIGPFHFVPGAWGTAGYAGHAAATGFIAGGWGLGLALRMRLGNRWWILPASCAAWILLEHMLTNLYVGSGSRLALVLGNGRLTPWMFLAMTAFIVAIDYRRHRKIFARSVTLRRRLLMTRAAMMRTKPPVPRSRVNAVRMHMAQLRQVNATAWFVRAR